MEGVAAGTSLYAVLGTSRGASGEELRRCYRRRALELHPDKRRDPGAGDEAFQQLQLAWSVLGDARKRAQYDKELAKQEEAVFNATQVDLDDLEFDPASNAFVYPCRCGDRIAVSEEDLDQACELFECLSCSLRIHVLFCASEEAIE
jgi:curved DNA-binding protein CbpA